MYKDFFNKITNGSMFTDTVKHGNGAGRAKKSSMTESIQSRRSHFSEAEEPER